jgi:hypothetical protein
MNREADDAACWMIISEKLKKKMTLHLLYEPLHVSWALMRRREVPVNVSAMVYESTTILELERCSMFQHNN